MKSVERRLLKPRKRLGRMRGVKLGFITAIKGGECARKGETKEHKRGI